MTERTGLTEALHAHAKTAEAVANGQLPLDELAKAAERVAAQAHLAVMDDPWETSATMGQILGRHVADARTKSHDWSQQRLADEMSALGFGWKRLTVNDVEWDRRRVSFDEMLGLAALLEQSLVALLSPPPNTAVEREQPNDSVVEVPGAIIQTLVSGHPIDDLPTAARQLRGLLRYDSPTEGDTDATTTR